MIALLSYGWVWLLPVAAAFAGALLVVLGAKIVMRSAAKFGLALAAVVLGALASFALQMASAFVLAAVGPELTTVVWIVPWVLGFLATPAIYSVVLRTKDGRRPLYVQALLIYLFQLLILGGFFVGAMILIGFVSGLTA